MKREPGGVAVQLKIMKQGRGKYALFLKHRRSVGLPNVGVTGATLADIKDIVLQEQTEAVSILAAASERRKAIRAV